MTRPILALALAVLLGACGDSPPDAADGAAAAPLDTVAINAAAGTDSGPAPRGRLALDGEGLRVFTVPSGSARPIPFGTPAAEVVRMLTLVQEWAPLEQGENLDCGARFATWPNGLTTYFMRDEFVGWASRDTTGVLTTASGIGVGSTRRELEDVYAAEIAPSTLGLEFTAVGLAGILASDSPDARIENLWAGAACVAR